MTHWDNQAATIKDDAAVNIGDIYQRELELDFICPHLKKDMTILEVGCGNGYSTSIFRGLVKHVDALDVSPAMIERARSSFGETNNTFYVDDLLTSTRAPKLYDAVICVRVLINLKDLSEQRAAVRQLKRYVAPKGRLILVEGFRNGFEELSHIRELVGLPRLEPAGFNFYSCLQDILPMFDGWAFVDQWHSGTYDYLTRIFYPLVVGADKVEANSQFAKAAMTLARANHNKASAARVHGYVLRRAT